MGVDKTLANHGLRLGGRFSCGPNLAFFIGNAPIFGKLRGQPEFFGAKVNYTVSDTLKFKAELAR